MKGVRAHEGRRRGCQALREVPMERELWPRLYRLAQEAAAAVRQKGVSYQPGLIVTVLLWAAIHDRPIAWACRPAHWSTTSLRPARLPSPSTMSRRARSL